MKLDIAAAQFAAMSGQQKKKYIANLFIKKSGAKPVDEGSIPVAVITAGLPGAGKTNIQKHLELFYTEHGAHPSHSEMVGVAGAATLNVPISALSPPENPNAGLRHGWSDVKIEKPTTSQYRFAYITHPNANGSGFGCASDQRCRSYDLTYISTDGTPLRLTNSGNVRGNWSS